MHSKAHGSIRLDFGGDQFLGLVAAGLATLLPLAVWLIVPTLVLGEGEHGSSSTLGTVVAVVFTLVFLFAPAVVPSLVLRARQPSARIEWDDEGVVEWSGDWKRTIIPWARVRAAHRTWKEVRGKGRLADVHALQLSDSESDAVITVWESRPGDAPVIRRRLVSPDTKALREALHDRKIALDGTPRWARACEPERVRQSWNLWVGRLGYVLVLSQVVTRSGSPGVTALGALAAALLAVRALPVLRELRMLMTPSEALPTPPNDPYRTPQPPLLDPGRRAAAASRLRAVLTESLVRVSFVVMTIVTTVLAR